jgi:hypothetical protein
MQPQTLRKPADTSRPATTTQTADPHLTIDVAASAVYAFSGWLVYDGGTVGDLVVGWSFPTGAQGTWGGHGSGTTVTSATAGGGTQQDIASTWGYGVRLETTALNSTRTYGALAVGSPFVVMINGTLRTSSTAGTFAMTWAQSSSSAIATTLYSDSWLAVQRTA